MNVCLSKRKKLARTLLRENRTRSYRTIARDDYQDRVDQSTLSRIARTRGEWFPKDERILIVLGMVQPRVLKPPKEPDPEWLKNVKRKIATMAKQTRIDLGLQK